MKGIIRLETHPSTVRGLTDISVASWRLRTSCEAGVVSFMQPAHRVKFGVGESPIQFVSPRKGALLPRHDAEPFQGIILGGQFPVMLEDDGGRIAGLQGNLFGAFHERQAVADE